MELFLADRVSIQYVMEPFPAAFEPQPYEVEVEMQSIFEICKIVQPAASEMAVFGLIDAFLASLRLDELEETHQSSFREVDRAEAGNILTYLLSYDLVHDYRATSLSEKQVATIVERFLTLFSSHPRYFTNGEFNLDVKQFGLRNWFPLTSHTFDTGLILVDEQRIGIFWEVAED
ncbi:MAG: hypothetical protein ACJ8BW_14370 [Ktedonobacteraceae bacterium]